MRENIEKEVIQKLQNLSTDDIIKEYIIDYLYWITKLDLLPENVNYHILLDRLVKYVDGIVIFDEEHEINNAFGHDFKGWTGSLKEGKKPSLYIREKLGDKVELYFYHELTHLLQKHDDNPEQTGLCTEHPVIGGDLYNEAIVQYIAEQVYNKKYNLTKEQKEYNSEELRMLPGLKIYSDLDNYQHFDYLTTLITKYLGVDKKYLSKIAFSGNINTTDLIEKLFYDAGINDVNELIMLLRKIQLIYIIDKKVYTKRFNQETINSELERQLKFYQELETLFKSKEKNITNSMGYSR